MNNWIVTAEQEYPIQPQHIDASQAFMDSFGQVETEISARWIVKFLQERGEGWKPFTYDEINAFYERDPEFKFFHFNRLVKPQMRPPSLARAFAGHHDPLVPVGGGWIILGDDQKYYITNDFIIRCFTSRPAQRQMASV